MPPSPLQHRRTHNLLLISKLLNQRDATSPFTLVLDSLEQSGRPLLAEYMRRANASKVKTIFISFETIEAPRNANAFISAWSQSLEGWQKEVQDHLKAEPTQRKLLLIDSLSPLATSEPNDLASFLSSFITPTTSLLALYHTDIPIPPSPSSETSPYTPAPLTLLKYLATTIFTTHSLHHILASKEARDRSRVEPSFGLGEDVEGVIQGLGANGMEGVVLEMEYRRRSGRGIKEWYIMPAQPPSTSVLSSKNRESITLLEDHSAYHTPQELTTTAETESQPDSTFSLGLTEKQRQDRSDVVLPYFDAQKADSGTGGGEGGRILYDMGSEDDFDEEEDEL